jgi:hypothetical protein
MHREGLIDHPDEVSTGIFIHIPGAPLKQWDAERGKISLVHQHHTCRWLLKIASSVHLEGFLSVNLNASIGRHGVGADSDSGDCLHLTNASCRR